ncbi:hypothetical protein Syun_011666 [Stephania yunnanensis]|uniref:IREH1/IRE-like N-terminal domain-containing protein n=1 Tax=Stephania yunnanensis TaxID=152371 RepID=A0AAP0JY07_9MAGN
MFFIAMLCVHCNEVNSDLSTFAGDLVSILEDSIDSHPEWRTRLEDLLIVARECAVMSASDFWKRSMKLGNSDWQRYSSQVLVTCSGRSPVFVQSCPSSKKTMTKTRMLTRDQGTLIGRAERCFDMNPPLRALCKPTFQLISPSEKSVISNYKNMGSIKDVSHINED